MAGPKKYNGLDPVNLDLSQLIAVANAATGKAGYSTLQALATLLLSAASAPAKTYADITELLANVDLVGNFFAYVADASDDPQVASGWGVYFFLGGAADDLANYLLVAQEQKGFNFRADYDASVNAFPDAPLGSGPAGALQRFDLFPVTVAGEIDFGVSGPEPVAVGNFLLYLGGGNWRIL